MFRNLRKRIWSHRSNRRAFLESEKRGVPIYTMYFFNQQEQIGMIFLCLGIMIFLGQFFYRSLIAGFCMYPIGIYVYVMRQKQKRLKRISMLEAQFKDCILSVSANLRAGYSVENAFLESEGDMKILHGKDSLICKELRHLKKGFCNNITLQDLLNEFCVRSGINVIIEFSEVLTIATKSGGSLIEIIQETVQIIGEEITMKQEIEVAISGRILEQKLMNFIPFFLYIYIELTNPGFFDCLYHNVTGIVIMTFCLILYMVSFILSKKISNLEE